VQQRPAYLVVADELRQQILAGRYAPGERLPTMGELRRAYGVSEIVIRHAVSLLRLEGLVETRRGGGTVVRARPQARRRAMERYAADARQAAEQYRAAAGQVTDPRTSFTEDHGIEWQEYQLTARYSEVPADEELAAFFGAEPGTALLCRHFVFYARGEPEQLSTSFMPLDLVAGTPVSDPAREPWPGGTFAQLAFLGHPVSRVEESVSARMPAESEARTLRVAQGLPVFAILRRLISGDAVLEVCRDIVIPADRVVLEYGIDVSTSAAQGDLADRCSHARLMRGRSGCRVSRLPHGTAPPGAKRRRMGRLQRGAPCAVSAPPAAGTGQDWRTRPFASASRSAGAADASSASSPG
jgi:GntR family transcriptional regulator